MSSEANQLVESEADSKPRMDLKVDIRSVGPCRKHVVVTIPEASISDIRDSCVEDLGVKAQVPGFRVGKVPRSLLVKRFKDEITGQVRQKVLLTSLEQLSEENNIDPISEPKLDVESLVIPDAGDFTYEFEVEVRPEFELPDFSKFRIRRPTGELSDAELDVYREQFLSAYATKATIEGPASAGDFVTCSLTFLHGDKVIREVEETSVQLLPTLNFPDAEVTGFSDMLAGVSAGETRTITAKISLQSPVVEMRGEEVRIQFDVKEVQKTTPPDADGPFLERMAVESLDELNKALRDSLERQIEFQQRQAVREQVLEQIGESANWDLPESIVRQQTENALRREILEMAQAGFTREQIVARENDIRRNAIDNTRQALKEHFVLDRVATQENIECEPADIERELTMMSFQSGEPVRKIRARMAKNGMIENLEAQLRERKAVDFILSKATFDDVPRDAMVRNEVASIRYAICGNMSASLIDDSAEATDQTA